VFTIKLGHGLNEVDYDRIFEWTRSILPEGNRLKENFYIAKSIMKPLGLGYLMQPYYLIVLPTFT
jgi:hypothetical protein